LPHLIENAALSGRTHLVELRHQAGLAPSCVVPVDNVLTRNSIEHAQRVTNRKARHSLITVLDRKFCLFDVGAGSRDVRPIPLPAPLSDSNALLGGFAICQLELPFATWLEKIRRTQKNGIAAAATRWYQTRRKSTTNPRVARGNR
jgi:hypothetical protein